MKEYLSAIVIKDLRIAETLLSLSLAYKNGSLNIMIDAIPIIELALAPDQEGAEWDYSSVVRRLTHCIKISVLDNTRILKTDVNELIENIEILIASHEESIKDLMKQGIHPNFAAKRSRSKYLKG